MSVPKLQVGAVVTLKATNFHDLVTGVVTEIREDIEGSFKMHDGHLLTLRLPDESIQCYPVHSEEFEVRWAPAV